VHDIGIVLAHENESGAPHVGRQLINLIKPAVDHMPTEIRITEISDDEIVRLTRCIFVAMEIHATNPKPVRLQALD